MLLLNPDQMTRDPQDEKTRELMEKVVQFFKAKGKDQMMADYHSHAWYGDFVEFVGKEGIFETICTPAGGGADDARWDTWRITGFSELLGFFGLQYWYTWQVSVLGLGPLWMSKNEKIRARTAKALKEGGIFAFGLSEKEHGADIYSTDMILTPKGDGTYTASGSKYYIGNGNKAAIVSTMGRIADSDEYVFFAVESTHPNYTCVKNVVPSSNYVSEYRVDDYPITEDDIIARGPDAWNAALNTINVGKYNLGWASIGICTHALYEAITHASNRHLYNMTVTDFPHVQRMFVDAYCRLNAMKLFADRACDYMRAASKDDRRYLLFNPMVKMKVTTQGEDVINLLWDVIAAKGFEKDMYFSQAAMDIRALPKLEGTVHVNIALIVKFMPNYFFMPAEYPEVPVMDQAANDDFLFDQGATKGLSKIRFHDYNIAFEGVELPNVVLFKEQVEAFKKMLFVAGPNEDQMRDIDFLLAGGELFALVVYSQLILENYKIKGIDDALLNQIFDFMVRDFSKLALELHNKTLTTEEQQACCLEMLRKPVLNDAEYKQIWGEVHALNGLYDLNRAPLTSEAGASTSQAAELDAVV